MGIDERQQLALRAIVTAVMGTIEDAGALGAPSGVLYAALSAHGCSLEQFSSLMAALVRSGRVRQTANVYYYTA